MSAQRKLPSPEDPTESDRESILAELREFEKQEVENLPNVPVAKILFEDYKLWLVQMFLTFLVGAQWPLPWGQLRRS